MSSFQTTISKCLSAAVIAAGLVFHPAPAGALDFAVKKVTLIVPFDEGSGSNRFARMFVPFFKKYLPGNPDILVRNMPGGGSVRGNNYFEKNAKPDGTTFIVVSTSSQTSYVFGGGKINYNPLKWEYILMTPFGSVFYVNPKTGVKGKNLREDIATLRKRTNVLGAKSPTSSDLRTFLTYELLGIKDIKSVFGLSAGERRKAVLRNELDGNVDSSSAYIKSVTKYVKTGQFIPLVSMGYTQNGKIGRDPQFPNIPTVIEAYKTMNDGKMPSGPLFDAYKSLYTMSVMTNKSFALPAKTPKAIVDAYVTAAKKTAADEAFQKIAKKQLGDYPIIFGEEGRAVVKDAVDISPEVRTFMKSFIREKFNINI